MKAVWSGSIAFGLVNIPINIYPATEITALGFRLLHKKDNTPIEYKRFCPKDKKEVAWNDIVRGLEIKKGEFYVFTKEELDKIKPKKTESIEITEFVDSHQIDPIYFNKHYFVSPTSSKEKAYFLFNEVLRDSAKVAIGRFVMRDKEYVCAIESYKNGMLLTTLNYAYEIRDIKEIRELAEKPKLEKEEVELAKKIISRLYSEEFEISKFKDTFAEELKEALKKKAKGIEIKEVKKPAKTKERGLMEALKASVK